MWSGMVGRMMSEVRRLGGKEREGREFWVWGTGTLVRSLGSMNLSPMIHADGSSTDLRLIDSEATGDTDAVYDLLGRKRDAQTKGLVIKNGIKVLK